MEKELLKQKIKKAEEHMVCSRFNYSILLIYVIMSGISESFITLAGCLFFYLEWIVLRMIYLPKLRYEYCHYNEGGAV